MALSKDVIMQNMQRFGGAMYTPVILFAFFGLEDSRHAVGLRMDNGAELLIHIRTQSSWRSRTPPSTRS